jgi:diguanylate cyclase (GGDEF)-like protein
LKRSASLIQTVTLQILAILLAISLISGLIVIYTLNRDFQIQTQELRDKLMDEQKNFLKAEVNRAVDYIRVERSRVIRLAKEDLYHEALQLHNQMERLYSFIHKNHPAPDAFTRSLFIDLVDAFNAQCAVDFTINSFDGIGIYHPKNPENVGRTLLHIKDAQHTRVVNEEIGMMRYSDEGFLSTFWKAPGKKSLRQVVSFIKKFEPYGWYLKASVDLDSFTKEIDEKIFTHLANRRFGKDSSNYFFINSFDGDIILSNGKVFDPRPNRWDLQDPNGIYIIRENSHIAQLSPQGGFNTYSWENLDGQITPKISFVRALPGRDLFIGAGVDLASIDSAIFASEKLLQKDISQKIYWIVGLFALATVFISLLMFYLAKRVRSTIGLFFKTFEKASTMQVEIPEDTIFFKEFRTLAKSANNLIKTLKNQQEEICYQANHDYLTGLPNRMLLLDRLEHAIIQAKRSKTKVAVVFMDLDFFKRINDTLGHDAGDDVLKIVTTRLESVIRESDTLARIGGDEFLFIFNFNNKDELIFDIINRIIQIVKKPLKIKDETLNIGCSLGISFYPDDGSSPDTLIKNADIAMYEAKSKGRNTFQCFNSEMDSKIHTIIHLERQISSAIESGEFELYYQPKVETDTGYIRGAEVLLRWNHPQSGLLGPNHFIDIAEDSGLIVPLGKWIIKNAFSQKRRWEKRGWHFNLAINLSIRQLKDPDFIPHIKQMIATYEINTNEIEFEITESFSAEHRKHINALNTLRLLGFGLAIDDFGTGYSSLSYLHKLPVNTVKIDKEFIAGMLENHDKMALVEIIIQIAKIMRLTVVAEGVENKDDLEALQYLKCDFYQGYYFSKPLSIAKFNSLYLQQY